MRKLTLLALLAFTMPAMASTFNDYYSDKLPGFKVTVERLCQRNAYNADVIEQRLYPSPILDKKGKPKAVTPNFSKIEYRDMYYALGKLYETGACQTQVSPLKAVTYYMKAADYGRDEAYFNMALIFAAYPDIFPADTYNAHSTMTPPAYNMNKAAQYLMAVAYLSDESKLKDAPEAKIQAVKWLLLTSQLTQDAGESKESYDYDAHKMIQMLSVNMTPEQLIAAHEQAMDVVKYYLKRNKDAGFTEKEARKRLYEVIYP